MCLAQIQGLKKMCLSGEVGKVRLKFLSISGRWPKSVSAASLGLTNQGSGPQPTHEEAQASRYLLTSLDGQEVVQFMQQLQQGCFLLGLTKLEGHRTGGQQAGKGFCLVSPPQPHCQILSSKEHLILLRNKNKFSKVVGPGTGLINVGLTA